MKRRWMLVVLMAIVCCMVLIAGISIPREVAYAADESGETTEVTEENAVVSVTTDSGVTYYTSFEDAVNALPDKNSGVSATITLLKDASFCGFSQKTFTLDLNGKVLTNASGVTTSNNRITIIDSVGTGNFDVTAALVFSYDRICFESGKITSSKTSAVIDFSGCAFELKGGTIDGRVWDYVGAIFNMTSGYIYKIDDNSSNSTSISGGEIGELCFRTTKTNVFTGGTINRISFNGVTPNFADLLVKGYAYRSITTEEWIKPSEMMSDTAVKIVECTHKSFDDAHVCEYCGFVCTHTTYDEKTWKCTTCDVDIVAKVIDESAQETFYASFADAVNTAPSADSGKSVTIKLLQQANFCNFSDKSLTIDLNGYLLYCSAENSSVNNSIVSILDTSEAQSGGISVNYSMYFENCTVNIYSGNFYGRKTDDFYYNQPYVSFVDSMTKVAGGNFELRFVPASGAQVVIGGGVFSKFELANGGDFASLEVSNAVISLLSIGWDRMAFKEGVEVKSVLDNSFLEFVKFEDLIYDGYAYKNAENDEYIKRNEKVTAGYHFKTVVCTHEAFSKSESEDKYLCDYCGYECPHNEFDTEYNCTICHNECWHKTFNADGVCEACGYVCPHDEVDLEESTVCGRCKQNVNISVTTGEITKYYIDVFDAFANLADGDAVKFLNDINVPYEKGKTPEISKNVTLDLNGKHFDGTFGSIYILSTVDIVDTADNGGYCCFIVTGNGNMTVRANQDTQIGISYYNGSVKIYSGKLLRFSYANNHNRTELLPEGYCYVKNGNDGTKVYLTWVECLEYTDDSKYYLTTEKCEHISFDSDLVCDYCHSVVPTGDAINRVSAALEAAKTELDEAIKNKVDVATFNEKVAQLNDLIEKAKELSETQDGILEDQIKTAQADAEKYADAALAAAKKELNDAISAKANEDDVNKKIGDLQNAIANAETVSKAYADQKDTELAEAIQEKINSAKTEVANTAKSALDTAKSELTDAIETKADANKVNEAIEGLRTAIMNAQAVNNAYVDENNQALKAELEGKIAQAEEEVAVAIAKLSERLDAVESKTATLQTVLIVFIVLLSLANIATVVMFVLRRLK